MHRKAADNPDGPSSHTALATADADHDQVDGMVCTAAAEKRTTASSQAAQLMAGLKWRDCPALGLMAQCDPAFPLIQAFPHRPQFAANRRALGRFEAA